MTPLSIILVIGALIALVFVMLKIRKGQIKTANAVFWFLFALCLLVIAVFPQVAFFASDMLGIESPANFIFLCIIAILVIKVLLQSVEIAKLEDRLSQLTQAVALEFDKEDEQR